MSNKSNGQGDAQDIERAKRNAELARARVDTTVGALKERLNPRHLAEEAKDRVREKTGEISDAAHRRPVTTGAVAGAATLLLFRKPVGRLAKKLFKRKRAPVASGIDELGRRNPNVVPNKAIVTEVAMPSKE